ncbi:hypothetical protein PENTCL1PPCAC_2742, partial [Pristionchus entomophagus]
SWSPSHLLDGLQRRQSAVAAAGLHPRRRRHQRDRWPFGSFRCLSAAVRGRRHIPCIWPIWRAPRGPPTPRAPPCRFDRLNSYSHDDWHSGPVS